MEDYQRSEAIDMLIAKTEVNAEEIEEYEDYELEAWLGELGYEWNPGFGFGMGAWESTTDIITGRQPGKGR